MKKSYCSDPKYFVALIIVNILFVSFFVFMISSASELFDDDGKYIIPANFIFYYLLLLITLIIVSPRWSRWFTFKSDSFECHTLFRKKEVYTYDNFRISYASYFHGTPVGLGSDRYYLVFSQRGLSRYERENINNANPKGIYKITYSKKHMAELRRVLPDRLLQQLEEAEKTILRLQNIAPVVIPQTQKKKRRKKKRKKNKR